MIAQTLDLASPFFLDGSKRRQRPLRAFQPGPGQPRRIPVNISCLDRHFQLFLRDLLTRRGFNPDRYCTEIDPHDEMFYKGILPGYDGDENISLFKYTESAMRTFDIYRQLAAHLGGFSAIGPVVGFGSGYGRLSRSF